MDEEEGDLDNVGCLGWMLMTIFLCLLLGLLFMFWINMMSIGGSR